MVNRSLRSNLYTLALVNTLRVSSPGVAESNKALIVDTNKDLSGIRNLSVENLNVGGALLTASASELNYVDTTPGIGESFRALVLDGNNDISNINFLSASYLTGTLQTASQPNITSLGTLSNLNIQGSLNIIGHNGSNTGLRLNNTLITASAIEINKLDGLTSSTTELNVLTGITSNVTQLNYTNTTKGSAEAEKALIVDTNRDINNIRNLTASNLTGTLMTASQPNITSVGTLNNLTVNGNINIATHNGSNSGLQLNGTLILSTATEINYLKDINPGTVIGNKVLAVDNNKDLLGFRNISLIGNLSTAQITLNGFLIQSTADEINYLYNITKGLASNNKAVVLDTNKDFSGIRNLTIDNLIMSGSNLQLPTGNTASRPISPSLGYIRYNTETSQFEGYGAGNSWGSLGGVINVQQTTKILAENSPGSNDNNLRFINSNVETMRISSTGNVGINNNNPSYKLDVSGTFRCLSSSIFQDSMTINKTGSNNNSVISGLIIKNTYSSASSSGLGIGIDFWMPDSTGGSSYSGSLNCVVTNPATASFANKFEFKLYNAGIINTSASIDSTGLLTISSLSTSTITATSNVNISGHNGSTIGLQLNGTLVTATATELNYNDITTIGTAQASKAIILDSSRNITNINNISLNNLALNNTTNYRSLIDCGSVVNDRILGLYNNVSSFYGFGANNSLLKIQSGNGGDGIAFYTGASNTSTGSERMRISSSTTNIINTLALNGVSITASANDINKLTSITAGIVSADKVLIVDSNKDLTGLRNLSITGDLIVAGSVTTINSTQITIQDNILQLNSGPNGSYDSGLIIQRYQTNNDSNIGDIINETAKENYIASSVTINTIVLPSSANSNDNYYNNWWIKIVSATTGSNQVRQILSYNGSTKTITLTNNFTTLPTGTITINLYNKSFSNLIWQESNKRFVTSYTAQDISSGTLTILDYADLATNNLNIISNTDSSSSSNGGSLTIAGGAAIAKKLYIGSDLSVTGNSSLTGSVNINNTLSVTGNSTLSGTLSVTGSSTLNNTLLVSGLVSFTNVTDSSSSSNGGSLTISGGAAIAKKLYIGSDLSVTGNSNLSGTLSVTGNSNLSGTLSVTGNSNLSGTLTVTGASTLNNTLSVSGLVSFTNVTDSSSSTNGGSLTVSGGAAIAKKLYIGSDLLVTGNSNLSGTLSVTGNSTLSGTLSVTNSGTFNSSLTVSGATILNSTLSVTGNSTLSGTLSVTGSSTLNNTLSVSGLVSFTNITDSSSSTNGGSLTISGGAAIAKKLYIGSDLSVTGNSTMSGTLTINNNSTITGTLLVTGLGTFSNGITVTGSGTFNNALSASGLVSFTNVTDSSSSSNGGSLTISGGAAIAKKLYIGSDLSVTGNTLLTGSVTLNNTLSVSNNTTLSGSLTVSGISNINNTLSVSGLVSFTNITDSSSSTNGGSLTVSGGAAIAKKLYIGSDLSVTGNSNLSGTISVTGNSNLSGTLTVTGSSTLNNTLSVSGLVNFSNITDSISSTNGGSLTISGGAAIAKKLYIGSDLSVTGNSIISGTLSVNGNITGTLATSNQPNITSVGILTSLSTNSLTLNGITITASANDINSLSGTSAGNATANKALVVDSNLDLSGIRNLSINGNLTVAGTTTTINSTQINLKDNILQLNSGPSGSYDSGLIIQRYQTSNDSNTGDIINEIAKENYTASSVTINTIVLPSNANTNNNYYNGWWIKIAAATVGVNQVRQVSSYVGSTKTITLSNNFTTLPTGTITVNLYNKSFSNLIWQESNKRFVTSYTAQDISSGTLTILDYADLATNNLNIISNTDASSSSNGGSLTIAGGASVAKKLYIGSDLSVTGNSSLTGTLTVNNTVTLNNVTDSTNSTTGGSLTIAGGAAIAKKLYVGSSINSTGEIVTSNILKSTASGYGLRHINGGVELVTYIDSTGPPATGYIGTNTNHRLVFQTNNSSRISISNTGIVDIIGTTSSTSSGTGILTVAGGIGIYNTTDATSINSGGSFTTAGGMAIAKKLYIGSDLSVTGNSSLTGTLTVTGITTLNNNLSTTGTIIFSNITDATSVTSGGSLTISGGTSIAKKLYVGSDLSINGNSTLIGTLSVGNNTTLSGTLSVTGNSIFSGSLEVTGATTINNILSVTGNTTLSSLSITSLTLNGILITSTATDINKLANVTATSTELNYTDTTVGTAVASKALIVDANRDINNINSLSCNSLSLSGTINTSGIISLTNTTESTTTNTGALIVSGGIGITKSATIGGKLTIGQPTSASAWGLNGIQSEFKSTTYTDTTSSGTVSNVVLNSYGATTIASSSPTTYSNAVTMYITSPFAGTNVTMTNRYALQTNGNVIVSSSTPATSVGAAAFSVSGGGGISAANMVLGTGRTLAAWGLSGPLFNTSSSTTFTDSSTAASTSNNNLTSINSFQSSTLAASNTNVTYSTVANLFIADGPSEGSNVTINNRMALMTSGAIVINGYSKNISSWGSAPLHIRSGRQQSVFTDTGSSNITDHVSLNYFNNAQFASNTAGRTMARTSTIHITGAPTTSGGNLTITNTHALYITSGNTTLADTTVSTSTTSGALIVTGGVGIGGSLNVGGTINTTGLYLNNILINSTSNEINTLSGITAGTALASKALILDSNKDITSINSLTATNLTGTLQTASQPNITSVGTLTSLSTGNITLNGTLITATATELNYLSGSTLGTISPSKVITVDASSYINSTLQLNKSVNASHITFQNGSSTGLIYHFRNSDIHFGTTSANGIVFQTNTTTRVSINSAGIMNILTGWAISGTNVTATATQLNYNDITTIGTAEASKALILDSSRNIININSLTATNLTGTLQTTSQPNITSVGTLTSLSTGNITLNGTLITATATELNYNDITTIGTAEASKALIVDANKDIQSIRRLHLNNISIGTLDYTNTNRLISAIDSSLTNSTARYLCLGKSYSNYNEAEWGYFHTSDGSTSNRQEFGFYGANGIFAITAGRKVGINNTGPNYDLDVTGDINLTGSLRFSGTAITATATELNYNDITTIGVAQASKALILDSLRNITNINSLSCTSLTVNGSAISASATELNYLSGIIIGIASENKALVVDSNKDITSIRNLTATNLTGTLQTASQPNITSVGTLTSLSTGNITLNGTLITATATELNYNDITTIGIAEASKALILDSSSYINGINKIVFNATSTTRQVSSSGDYRCIDTNTITFNNAVTTASGTDSAHQVSNFIGRHTITATNTNVTTTTFSTFYIQGEPLNGTNMTITNKYALYINSGNSYLSGNINIAGHNGSSTGLQLNGTLVTATAAEINILDGVTATTAELNYLDITSIGTAQASKALIVDSNKDITSIRNLTATNLTGTLQTASQPNITSVGTLTSLSTGNITLNGTLITATATEINYNDITTIGTAEASKALIVDSNKDITSIRNLSATNLTGTLQTASQPNITSVGTLTSLSTGNITLNGTLITATATELNYNDITTIGIAEASKALIVDTNKDITGIRNLTITGDLTVSGITTTINSTQINLKDNILQLNSGPSGSYDAGLIIQRYQTVNDTNIGDIVNETHKETYIASSVTTNTIVLPAGANSNNDYYKNWWIKIASATTGTNQVRQVSSYVGSTKTMTLTSNFTTLPTGTITINLYNKSFSNLIWQESNKRFITSYTAQDSSAGILTILDYADLATNNLNIISNIDASSSSNGGSLTIAGGAAIAKKLYIGSDLSVTGNTAMSGSLTVDNNVTFGNLTSSSSTISFNSANSRMKFYTHSDGICYIQAGLNGTVGSAADLFIGNYNHEVSASIRKFMIKADGKVGIGLLNPSYSLDVNGSINSTSFYINGTQITATATELNYNDITTIGTAQASKALIVDANKDITSIRNLTATNLTGTLQTASQTNITSVGTLTSLSTGNITLNGTLITATATDINKLATLTTSTTELNYLSGITLGTTSASKVLTVDSSRNINNINTLSTTGLISNTIVNNTSTNVNYQTWTNDLTTDIISVLQMNNVGMDFGTTSNNSIGLITNNIERLLINSGGNISIGNNNDTYKLDVTGDINLTGSIRFSGTIADLSSLSGATAGTGIASKALILDSSRNIININSLTATNLTGTLQTASQTNITSVGTLTSLISSGNIVSSNANASFRILPHTDNIVYLQAGLNTTSGSAADLFIGNYAQTTLTSSRKIIIKADGKVGLGTASPSYTLDVIGDINLTGSLRFSGIASDLTSITGITAGTATASKALIIDSNKDITSINSLSATNLTGTLQTASQPNITSVGTLTSLSTSDITLNGTLITATATELNYNDITTIGIAEASKALILDSSRNISNINSISLNGSNDVITLTNSGSGNRTNIRFINDARSWELGSRGSTISNPNLFYLYDNTASAYRLTINSSGNVNIVNHNGSSTGLQLNGTLITATATELNILDGVTATTAELNILDGVTATTAELNILDGVTATTAELNYLDITSAGTAQASKALIVDANKDITSIRNLTATNLTGTLQTSNQTNITSVGTLTSLSTGNITLNGTLITATAAELNILDGVTATAAELNILDGVTATAAELNILDGVTATTAELNYLDITSVGTAQASKALVLDSSSNITGINNLSISGILTVGTVGSEPNRINFSGTTSDASNNHTVIAERIYGGTEQSELLIFKGNDPISTTGPDRIRLRASEFRFQTYTSAEDFSGLLDNNDRIVIANNGNVGIGTYPSYRFDFGSSAADIILNLWGGLYSLGANGSALKYNSNGAHRWYTSSSAGTLGTNTMTLTSSGTLGIGTTNPSTTYLLEANGAIRAASYLSCANYTFVGDNGNYGRYIGNWTGANYWGIGAHSSNQVRIGICNSTGVWSGYADVFMQRPNIISNGYGISQRNTEGSSAELITWNDGTTQGIGSYSSHSFRIYANNSWRIRCEPNGDVVRSTGSTSFTSGSDIRLKEDIINADLNLCYNNIKELRLVYYKWKDFTYENTDISLDKHRLGWIAQELETILPKSVTISNNYGLEDCKHINVDQLYATLYGCTKKIINDKEILEEKVNNLEIENKQLKDQIENQNIIINQILERLQNLENNN